VPADHYCSYFDHRYAAQGLAMIRSLRAQGGTGPVWVLCLSEAAGRIVEQSGLPDVRTVALAEVERHFPDLAAARNDRSTIEYYFTLTPHIVRYVFDQAPDARRVAYLDGDLFFFGPAEAVWAEMGDAPAAIIPHNFHRGAEHLGKYGRFNVGWVSFARSDQGLACLDFWASGCREWCRDVPDGGRFADQGYLDRFHEYAPDLAVITHKGCNLGPWNVGGYDIRVVDGAVRVDEDPLLFFHFTGFKKGLAGRWFNSHRIYRTGTTAVVRDHIYRPYLAALLASQRAVAPLLPPESGARPVLARNRGGGVGLKARLYKVAEGLFRLWDLATGKALAEPRNQAPASVSNSARSRT
jgi:hypothetical protein